MQACRYPDTGFTQHDLDRVFPFHASIDDGLRLLHCGPALKKILPGGHCGDPLDRHFEILAPIKTPDWQKISQRSGDLWILKIKASGLKLRGEILHKAESAHLLVTPWLSDTAELARFDLNLSDFAIHDLTHDLLLLKQAEKIALEDARRINRELMHERASLKELNRALELRETHARELAEIISRSNSGVCITQPDGCITWANAAFEKQAGMHLDQLTGQPLLKLPIFQHEAASKLQQLQVRMSQQLAFDIEICDLGGAAQSRAEWYEINFQPLLDAAGRLASQLAFFRNITEKKTAVMQLSRLSADLSNIFQLCPDGLIAFDSNDQLTYANPALHALTGLAADEISGLSISRFNAIIAELSLEASNHDDATTTLVFSRPRTAIIKRTTRQTLDEQGNILGTIQYFRDITHEYEMEQMKSEFLSIAAHELRTPMSSIHGFVELLLKREFTLAQQKEMISTVYRQTSRLIDMLNDLLDLARIESKGANALVRAEHDLVDIVRQATQEFSMQMQIESTLSGQPLRMLADRDKLIRAIGNVLSNARKYSATGRLVTVELSVVDDNGKARIRIVDQGIGMTPAQTAKLFTRFYRADSSGQTPGTGLGLCLVKEIIELHGGRIEIHSEFGKGTCVDLLLPASDI